MARVLIAGLIAMVIAVAVGPYFIAWLKRQSIGQQIREEGPAGHVVKAGTPTMGGLLILVAALVPALIVSLYTVPGITIILATLGCGLIGFADDYLSVRRRRSLGLSGRWKLAGLVLITAGVGWATTQVGYMDTEIDFPLVDVNIDLHWLYFPFLFLVIAGTSNGVNLTDGLDGLAAGTCAISLITLLAIAVIDWLRSSPDDVAARSHEYLDIAIVAAALIGGVYLVEILSVMIQVASFKRTGKRVFLMAPIHHHFEMKAWSETKIMVRFWIVGAILCAIGFALYYRYYLRFQL